MKYILINITITMLFINTIIAQQKYPHKSIYDTHKWESQNNLYKNTHIKYTLTAIDTILNVNDTVFNVKYYEEIDKYKGDTLYDHKVREQYYGGYIYEGVKVGDWQEWEFQNGSRCVMMNRDVYYYNGKILAHFWKLPILSFEKYYFLKDTAVFYLPPLDIYNILSDDYKLFTDTMFFKITSDKSWIYIGEILVDSIETRFFEDKVLDMLSWNSRKYRILLDSLKNAK